MRIGIEGSRIGRNHVGFLPSSGWSHCGVLSKGETIVRILRKKRQPLTFTIRRRVGDFELNKLHGGR